MKIIRCGRTAPDVLIIMATSHIPGYQIWTIDPDGLKYHCVFGNEMMANIFFSNRCMQEIKD